MAKYHFPDEVDVIPNGRKQTHCHSFIQRLSRMSPKSNPIHVTDEIYSQDYYDLLVTIACIMGANYMSKRSYPTAEDSGLNQKKHEDSPLAGKSKTNKPESSNTKTTERIIQDTSIKRQKAIKELANR